MTEETAKVLDSIASKLGTTSEYLWGVLLKQAPIDATITLIQVLFIIFCGVLIYRKHNRYMKIVDGRNENYYYYNEHVVPLMVIASILWGFFAVAAFFSVDDIFIGFFNPEYWALKEILRAI